MPSPRVVLEITGGLAHIRFVNPSRHNAMDLQFCNELADAATRCSTADGLKAVLLAAEGDVFCVGGDIREFVDNRERLHEHVLASAAQFHVAVTRLHRLRAPLIVAVNGTAAGGGFSMVCAADFAIAKRSAKLNPAYTRSGLTPDGGGTWFLPRIVGLRKAFEIFATNPTLSADVACSLGIVSRVLDDAIFDAAVAMLARQIEEAPAGVLCALKSLMRKSLEASLEEQLGAEAASIAAQAELPETQRLLAAFLGKGR